MLNSRENRREDPMITELAILEIDPENADLFENTYREVVHILKRQAGFLSEKLLRAIEAPEQYILAVEWESVGDHQRFIDAPDYPDLDSALGQFVVHGSFYHYNSID